jgi:hypothetical protein
VATGLTQIGMSASLTWQLARAVTGFTDVTQGSESASFASNSLDVATWNELFAAQYTMATLGTQVVDLRAFTDLAGNSVTGTKAMAFIILVTGAVTDTLNVLPNTPDGLIWPFHDLTSSVDIPGGGMLMFSEGPTSTGKTIDGTHKQLLLTNNGLASLTVKIVVLVSTH